MLETSQIDHTVLGSTTSENDVNSVINEALNYGMNICIPPCFVEYASEKISDSNVELCTVIGFPHGNQVAEIKRNEASIAVEHGATEIDMVAPLHAIESRDKECLETHIKSVVNSVDVPVKVIIESNIFDEDDIRFASETAETCGADFVKTSTGFTEGGARVKDVEVMSEYLPVKASGGVSNLDEANSMLDAGATRIGCSSGREIAEEIVKRR